MIIKKLDFDLKMGANDCIGINGKNIMRGNDKARFFASKIKEICAVVDHLNAEIERLKGLGNG